MAQTQAGEAERLTLKTKLAFGVGSAAEMIALYSVSSFALLFYNQVLGVSAAWVGLALSISLVADGLLEPVVGSLSDRTRSKLGRRHPWMFAAPIPIALALFAVFSPPAGLSDLALAVWCGVSVSCMRWAMTFFHTPHLALGGELAASYLERSKVMAYNSFFTFVGGAGLSFVALTFFFPQTPAFHNGLLNPGPWNDFAFAMSVAIVLILTASAWFTRDRIPYLPKPSEDTPRFSLREFFGDVAKALTNVNYVWLLAGYFFLSMMLGLREGLRLYVYSFLWEISSSDMRLFIIGSFIGYVTAFVFAAKMHGRFDKKRTAIWSAVAYAVIPGIPTTLGLLGVLKADTPGLLPILIAFATAGYAAVSILQISIMSALADIADENELKHGVRQEGILYSTRALAAKLDQAIGTALAGFVITLIAFPDKASPGQVDFEVLQKLALWDGVLAAIPGVLAAVCYGRYRIDRQAYQTTREALAKRRSEAFEAAGTAPTPNTGAAAPAPAE
ncbi:MFS transporter [Phenylobacterium sp. J367]|uniref:MFS transporter n=1 Tax=Phenylobacterium sp. J367 TaxID=2898435 RepID=UPI002151DBF6|nr:MFS transporter [Phenylobacterium sp. J367]MCR5878161.1 MFS transporter [Phenylobacterium sp. J367]